jgi:hypothetical protein
LKNRGGCSKTSVFETSSRSKNVFDVHQQPNVAFDFPPYRDKNVPVKKALGTLYCGFAWGAHGLRLPAVKRKQTCVKRSAGIFI